MSNNDIYVLGTGLSHDGSACILKNGKIAVAIEKERITRVKHDGLNDSVAIQYCLDALGITLKDIAVVVQNANYSNLPQGNGYFEGERLFLHQPDIPVVSISHHLAHAYSCIGTSPFEGDFGILVVDGCGSSYDDCTDLQAQTRFPHDEIVSGLEHLFYEKDSYYVWRDGRCETLNKDFSPWGIGLKGWSFSPRNTLHSIGGVYQGASLYCLGNLDDVGKLMGLGPYGRGGVYSEKIFSLRDGRVFVDYDVLSDFRQPIRSYQDLVDDSQYYADIAYWVQREIERALQYVASSRLEQAPCQDLCFTGGVALNAVANREILLNTDAERLYMQPAAGDNGLAIGCAYYGWLEVLKKERILHDQNTCFGISYDDEDIEKQLGIHPNQTSPRSLLGGLFSGKASERELSDLVVTKTDAYIDRAAEHLLDGKVIAWFQGGSEFGPRALGHRSILADPRRHDVRDYINAEIKEREDFRPFAPSVLAECVEDIFIHGFASPYMILVDKIKPEWRDKVPAIVHQDGSCRVQTVTPEWNNAYYKLLQSFERLSGVPMLLNTSFNKRGMPIVETPFDAIDFFRKSKLDVLIIEDYVVTKR